MNKIFFVKRFFMFVNVLKNIFYIFHSLDDIQSERKKLVFFSKEGISFS